MSLSNIDLFLTSDRSNDELIISGDEFHHLHKVMRYREGDKIWSTDGAGHLFECVIKEIEQSSCRCSISSTQFFPNKLGKFTFSIPILRSAERFEFALEKVIELGYSQIHIFRSERCVKKNISMDRLERIALHAMKQSLHVYLPKLSFYESPSRLQIIGSTTVLFDVDGKNSIDIVHDNQSVNLIFGPEGGFSSGEKQCLTEAIEISLSKNRLRTETAIIYAASLINYNNSI